MSRKALFVAGLLASSLAGCGSLAGDHYVRNDYERMDSLDRCGKELEAESNRPRAIRSQMPTELAPVRIGAPGTSPDLNPPPDSKPGRTTVAIPGDIKVPEVKPVTADPGLGISGRSTVGSPATEPSGIRVPDVKAETNNTFRPVGNVSVPGRATLSTETPRSNKSNPLADGVEGDTQVKIVASIGNNPVFDAEVRESVYQRLGEIARLPDGQQATKYREIYREELRKIIERELVLDEMVANLTAKKQTQAITKVKELATKQADINLREAKKRSGASSDKEFAMMLQMQRLTVNGIRRQIERNVMSTFYLRERIGVPEAIPLTEIRDYYDKHKDEFKSEDRVKWQCISILNDQYQSPAQAKATIEQIAERVRKGEDFVKLCKEYDRGDNKERDGFGFGEIPGEIFPNDFEPTILALKQNQMTIKATENGYHLIRIADRSYKGTKPFTEKVQADIREKVRGQMYERETKRLIETLWKRAQPQIFID